MPDGVRFDGVSLAKTLRGAPQPELADRKLVVQFGLWAEFVGPKKWESCVMQDKWRLVKGKELYDIASDPGQETNVADKYPEMVSSLRDYYEQWWTRNEPLTREFQPIHLGSDRENPVFLGAEDWEHWGPGNMFGVRQGTNPNLKGEPWNGPWHVLVEREGNYEISLRRWPVEADAAITAGVPAYKGELIRFQAGKALPITSARLKIGRFDVSKPVETSDKAAVFTLHLPPGKTTLQTWFYDGTGKELCGAFYTYVRHLPDTAS